MIQQLASLAYPPMCAWSGSPVASGTFADDIREQLLLSAQENLCLRCGGNIGPHLVPSIKGCDQCRDDRFWFEGVIRLGRYDGLLAEGIRRMKRLSGYGLARALAELLWEIRHEQLRSIPVAAVVPVPHHRWTEWRRGYNPSEVLAEVLAEELSIPLWPRALRRTRWTPPQHHLRGMSRRSNVKDAFQANRMRSIAGSHILLVDDVFTSGSTASESAKALRQAGAAKVHVVVLARGGQRWVEEKIVPKINAREDS
ncbi:ComF family protein [bacterium]|nr:ComF family protein [bacterium]